MRHGPNITGIAALIGDAARAKMPAALLAGPALTATELAAVAGVTPQRDAGAAHAPVPKRGALHTPATANVQ